MITARVSITQLCACFRGFIIKRILLNSSLAWTKWPRFRKRRILSLLLRAQLTIFQHWFRQLLGAARATSHYLNQCWPSWPTQRWDRLKRGSTTSCCVRFQSEFCQIFSDLYPIYWIFCSMIAILHVNICVFLSLIQVWNIVRCFGVYELSTPVCRDWAHFILTKVRRTHVQSWSTISK